MTATIQSITAADLLRMPDDSFRYELVTGELKKMVPAGHMHGKITVRLTWRLAQYVEHNNLGAVYAAETGFLLSSDPDTVRAPDIAFISQKRIEEAGEIQGYWPGAPDLAVEVVSPNDIYTQVEEKVFDWLEAGTAMVIIINPSKCTVTVYRSLTDISILTADDTLDAGDVVPNWEMPVADLFA
jgi:Uma2 family endonuclease